MADTVEARVAGGSVGGWRGSCSRSLRRALRRCLSRGLRAPGQPVPRRRGRVCPRRSLREEAHLHVERDQPRLRLGARHRLGRRHRRAVHAFGRSATGTCPTSTRLPRRLYTVATEDVGDARSVGVQLQLHQPHEHRRGAATRRGAVRGHPRDDRRRPPAGTRSTAQTDDIIVALSRNNIIDGHDDQVRFQQRRVAAVPATTSSMQERQRQGVGRAAPHHPRRRTRPGSRFGCRRRCSWSLAVGG